MLDFERLDVYRCALQFASVAFRILESIPRGRSELGDQLRRASLSIPLNIAEGSGRTGVRERARYHAIARGSAMECAAILDVMRLQGVVEEVDYSEAKELVRRLVAMLSRMAR